eukprot:scaffold606247_cov20-Prasinocladus_malaysianus.AAC.1
MRSSRPVTQLYRTRRRSRVPRNAGDHFSLPHCEIEQFTFRYPSTVRQLVCNQSGCSGVRAVQVVS